jgi:hypothetical protein
MIPKTEPPQWGEYSGPAEFYRSPQWLRIVRSSLREHRAAHRAAIGRGDLASIKFYEHQIAACRQQLSPGESEHDNNLPKRGRARSNRPRIPTIASTATPARIRPKNCAAASDRK